MSAQNSNEFISEEKLKNLLSELTLEEKAKLCSGKDAWSTFPVERLGIPSIWMADGPHGLRRAPETHLWGYGDQLPATCFPTASALSASWDVDLLKNVGIALGKEAKSINVNILLGPGVNIKRSVLGGRNFEYFTEDPLLSGELGAAYVNGVQSQGVGTSLKHFAANNVETNRMYINSAVDLRTLNEIYLTPFEIVVKKAQPWTVMACYNRVMGVYGSQSDYLLTEMLRDEWGFEGMVISDWDAVVDRVKGIETGMNVQMPGPPIAYSYKLIMEAVNNGKLDISVLDEAVEDILKVVFMANALADENATVSAEDQHNFARKVASETITLLKNDNNVLPIDKSKIKKIAVIGEFAANPRFQGNGSSEVKPTKLDKFLDIFKAEYGSQFEVEYSQGYNLSNDNDFSMIDDAATVAANSDFAIILAGLPLHYESEGIDRHHINLPEAHNKLIEKVSSAQPNSVVVLTNGSAIAMPWVNKVNGIVEAWLGGQAGAGAVADVLMGKVNPSGKLAESFPVRLQDTPAYLNFPGEEGDVLYGERMFVGYRYYDKREIEPLFPFGFGLSYTSFEYSNLSVSSKSISDKDELTVSFEITNTGKIAGKEIVQLYVSDIQSSLQRPVKELKGFSKVSLNPGESKTVELKLNKRDFSYYDSKREMWIAESGDFKISVGSSSRDLHLEETVKLVSTEKIPVNFDEYTFIKEYWDHPESRKMIVEAIPTWLKEWTEEGKPLDQAKIVDFLIYQPIIKLPYFTGGEITLDGVMKIVNNCKELTFTP